MNKLPAEVFQNIFNYLRRDQLSECLFVSKSWHRYVNQMIWKTVSISYYQIDEIKYILDKDDSENYFKYGYLTQTMSFQKYEGSGGGCFGRVKDEKKFTKKEITRFMAYFPNIEEIIIGYSHYDKYLRLLLHADLKKLKKVRTTSSIDPFENDSYDSYMALCLKHSDKITSIEFDYTRSIGMKFFQMVKLPSLSRPFKNLTDLTFRNCLDKKLTFMQVQEAFPHVTSLYYENEFPTDDSIIKKQIDRIGDSAIQLNRNLKSLEIVAPMSSSFIKYLIKYLPDQLEKLNLNIKGTCLPLWMNAVGEKNVLELIGRINSIQGVNIFFEDERKYGSTVPADVSTISNHLKVANALIRNKKKFTFKLVNTYLSHHRFTYNSSKGLNLEFGYDYHTDFSEKDKNTIEFNLSEKAASTSDFENIDCVEFYYDTLYTRHQDIPRAVIKHIFSNYPNLDRFILKDGTSPHSEIRAHSLKETKGSGSTLENLKDILLFEIPRHQIVLETLATCLPSVESMRCVFDSYDDSSYDNLNFNLNTFNNLTQFYFCVGVADGTDLRYLKIDIHFEKKQKKTYCYDGKIKKMTIDSTTVNEKLKNMVTDFNATEDKTETVTFKINQRIRLELYDREVGTIAVFNNGELLSLDYPMKTNFLVHK